MNNLNNIISENNIIGTSFSADKIKVEDQIETSEKISNEENPLKNITEKTFDLGVTRNFEEMNELTKKIFKK